MSPRELVILILGLAIVAVILRGLYVALHARRGQIRLAIDKNIPRDVDLDALEMAELPSGGARVVARSFAEVNRQNTVVAAASAKAAHLDLGDRKTQSAPVPVLMDPVTLHTAKRPSQQATRQVQAASAASLAIPATADAELEDDADSVLFDYGKPASAVDNLSQVAPDYPDDDDDLDDDDFDDDYDDFDDDANEDEDSEFADDDFAESDDEDDDDDLDEDEDDFADDDDDDDEYSEDEDFEDDEYDPLDEEEDDLIDSDLDKDLGYVDDDLDEFSMTAGERIGSAPTAARPAHQSSLFHDDDVKPAKPEKRKTLFAAFGRKPAHAESPRVTPQPAAANVPKPKVAAPVVPPSPAKTAKPQLAEKPPIIAAKPKPARVAPVQESQKNKDAVAEPVYDKAAAEPSEVIVINVMAKSGRLFVGDDLLHVLITSGMKFGDMNIFHRRLGGDNKGPVIFSIANILNPGTFDLNRMHDFTTLGVSLFLALPTSIKNLDAFDQMLSVAQQICGSLDGDLRDDNRNLMTAQTIEHYRQRIRDFELRRLKAVGTRG